MPYYLVLAFSFFINNPSLCFALDYHFDGRFRWDNRYIIDSPEEIKDYDHAFELRIGGNGKLIDRDDWVLDYEVLLDTRYAIGASEQVGFIEDFDVETFRGWLRLDKNNWRIRGGRQQILFGAGALFRPLGFFDNRLISSVFPQTIGTDSLRFSYFPSETSTVQGWLVPAKLNNRFFFGGRLEGLFLGLETGFVMQYSPVSDLEALPNYDLELVQVGYHFKGEREVGFWGEGRLDYEQGFNSNSFRSDSVFGIDYTFDIGEGLHFLLEYFLSVKGQKFTNTDLQNDRTIHQFGLQLDQPIGIATVWRVFSFFDFRDGSFQMAPQVEYSLTDHIYLYFQGNWGGDIKGEKNLGRLFRRGPTFTRTESSLGFTVIVFF